MISPDDPVAELIRLLKLLVTILGIVLGLILVFLLVVLFGKSESVLLTGQQKHIEIKPANDRPL